MSEQKTVVSDDELHAYVDGTLADARRAEVERALERDPALAARVSDYYGLNNLLHERYDRVLSEPLPPRLQQGGAARGGAAARFDWSRLGGMAAALAIGVGLGVSAQRASLPLPFAAQQGGDLHAVRATAPVQFAHEVALAHVVYMPSVYRPPGMNRDNEADFTQWIARQLGTDAQAPVLTDSGFELTGGRLLQGNDGPMAQYMYRNAQGERLTVCISHRDKSVNATAFEYYVDGPVKVFYWVDGKFGYAVSGGFARNTLLDVAHAVAAQLTGKG